MKESISVFLKRLSDILEFVISFILTAGIILLCLRVAGAIYKIPDLNVGLNYEDLLETCFNLIIGVELIKMMLLSLPTMTVFEVLLFAIAKTNHHRSFFHLEQSCRCLRNRCIICHT